MQHPAVMAGLVLPYRRFFFEQSNGGIREPLVQPVGRGQPHDPPPTITTLFTSSESSSKKSVALYGNDRCGKRPAGTARHG